MPRISVLMPVYNGSVFLSEAIESILEQTYPDFEFIIINDGSTDDTGAIIDRYRDLRIKRIDHKANLGIITSLNEGLDAASGEFIARMDADDYSMPHRLSMQLAYMDSYPDIGVCGSSVQVLGTEHIWHQPVNPEVLKCRLLFRSCLAHPTVMFRRSLLDEHSIRYEAPYIHAEDYQLWVRLSRLTLLSNIPEVLLHYRLHPSQISQSHQPTQLRHADRIRYEQLQYMGIEPDKDEFSLHLNLCYHVPFPDSAARTQWIHKLLEKNLENRVYEPIALMNVLSSWM